MSATTDVIGPASVSGTQLSERAVIAALFISSCLYMLVFRRVVNMEPDEGIVLQGAQRIMAGQVPYRDFFTFYTPGSFYFTALLFKIFGDSILTARDALVFFGAVFPVITYALARRTCARWISLLIAILVAIDTAPYRFLVLHNWDSTFWVCLSAYCAVRWLAAKSNSFWAWAAGTLTSFAFLTEQSKGAGLLLGLLIGTIVLRAFGRPLRRIGFFVVGALWPIVLILVYFGLQGALGAMLGAWLWPLQHYSEANRVSYGHQNWSDASRAIIFHDGSLVIRSVKALAVSPGFVIPVLPLIAVALLAYWTVQLRQRRDLRSEHYVLLSAIILGLLVSVAGVRADIIHFVYLSPLFYLVLAWILDSTDFYTSLLFRARPYLLACVVASFAFMGLALLSAAVSARYEMQTRRGSIRMRAPDSVLQYALLHTRPDEKLLVYPYLPLYYYLTATQSSSPYDYFQPGMSTEAQAQRIIHSIKATSVSTVLLEPNFVDKIPNSWPGTPFKAITVAPVADYIARNYRACQVLRSAAGWQFLYLRRADTACP